MTVDHWLLSAAVWGEFTINPKPGFSGRSSTYNMWKRNSAYYLLRPHQTVLCYHTQESHLWCCKAAACTDLLLLACIAQERKVQNSLVKHNSSVIAENRNTVCKNIRAPSLLLKGMDPSAAGIKRFSPLALMTSERNGISSPSGLADK